MVKIDRLTQTCGKADQVIAAADMGQFVRQYCLSFRLGPLRPFWRQKDDGPPPADRGCQAWFATFLQFDVPGTAECISQSIRELEQSGVVDRATAPSQGSYCKPSRHETQAGDGHAHAVQHGHDSSTLLPCRRLRWLAGKILEQTPRTGDGDSCGRHVVIGQFRIRESQVGNLLVRRREDKVACLCTLHSTECAADPHPEVPRCYLDRDYVRTLVDEMHT
jgi:hypothetical protein